MGVPASGSVLREVLEGKVQKIESTEQLHPIHMDEMHGEECREDAERERADDAVLERLLLLTLGKRQHQDRQNEGVVRAQRCFEQDQEPDRDEVGAFDGKGHGSSDGTPIPGYSDGS